MSKRKTCKDIHSATSLPELVAGHTPSDSPDGRTTDQSGQEAFPANRSALPERGWPSETNGTFGPLFEGSSPSADLQRAVASKLRARLDVSGSQEYVLTWKQWDMPLGPPICRLLASARPKDGNDCSGWQTPRARGDAGGNRFEKGDIRNLEEQAQLAGWPTTTVNDSTGSQYAYSAGDHNKKVLKLPGAARLAGWPTCTTRDHKDGTAETCKNVPDNTLPGRVALTAGLAPLGGPAQTKSGGGFPPTKGRRLNPFFSAWLLGFPTAWTLAGLKAHSRLRGKSRGG